MMENSESRVIAFLQRNCNSAFILVLLVVFSALIFIKSRDQAKSVQTWDFQNSFPDRPNHWSQLNDLQTRNCNFENYALGQPVEQDDPCLIATVKKEMLIPIPSFEKQNHEEPNITGEMTSNIEKFQWIEKLLIENSSKTDGFFIECGANDGEFISPTIRLETKYNWTGLLIEANPNPFERIVKKKRNAWAINAAACVTPHPQPITFFTNSKETGVSGINKNPNKGVTVNVTVQCIPMYTMIKAVGVTTIDYFSLNVKENLDILRTIPWDKINVKVMTLDHVLVSEQEMLKDFLEPKGYRFVKEILDSLNLDCLFVHEGLFEKALQVKFQ